jgi:glycosyltransferase involved in cell wall biosynthesis
MEEAKVIEKKSKISVVVASYRGEQYIIEQLESIRTQTRQPDEVIIRDDCSSDSTVQLISEYIKKNQLSSWKLLIGETNVGWKINFKKALYEAIGDIIFLCDQDDIWVENKIETMVSLMESNEEIELLASDFHFLIDGKIIERKQKKEELEFLPVGHDFFHTTKPGCVFAIRQSLLEEIHEYWDNSLPHDAQLWVLSRIRHSLCVYNKPLIYYRRHIGTATGRDKIAKEPKLRNINYERGLLRLAREFEKKNHMLTTEEKVILDRADKYVEKRKELFEKRSLFGVLSMLPYISCYINSKTFLGDVYVAFIER